MVYEIQADARIAFFVAASPDGTILATVGQDTRIRLWDAETGALLRTFG
jgi:WD40 repeat protein